MLGIESEVRRLSEKEKEDYQEIIIKLIKDEADFKDVLESIYAEGWYAGYEDCLNEEL